MANALLVCAHPNSKSFNVALAVQTEALLFKHNCHVRTSMLYQELFDPVLSARDLSGNTNFDQTTIAQMQLNALNDNHFVDDIALEQNKLREADWLILQFPLWWGSYPAILKGWIERVCSYGFAYGPAKQLAGKKVLLSVTTGGAENEQEHQYYLNKIEGLGKEVFGYMGMECLTPIISHGPASKTQAEREVLLEQHEQALLCLLQDKSQAS